MSLDIYNRTKQKYEDTKPIRGRAVDVRPWDDRRRDNQQVVRFIRAIDGAVMYGAKLYETIVFEVDPSGNITLHTGGWNSKTTTEFLDKVLRSLHFGCAVIRRHNFLWVAKQARTWHRIESDKGLTFTYNKDTHSYKAPMTTVTRKTVNRLRIKEVRAKLKPFKDYCNAILKLSEGYISGSMYKDYATVRQAQYGGRLRDVDGIRFTTSSGQTQVVEVSLVLGGSMRWRYETLYNILCLDDQALYQPLLLMMSRCVPPEEAHFGESFIDDEGRSVRSPSVVITTEAFNRVLDDIIKSSDDSVWQYKEVVVEEPTKDDAF